MPHVSPRAGAQRPRQTASGIEKAALAAVASTILFLALAACGPVTDPDSLDYHLGVPLDWLRHGGVTLQPHWLHARLTGLGESLNTLGLAAGTDCLGALLQVSGLIAVMAAIASFGKTLRDKLFGLLLALPPALLPLTTSQKPQLLPAAAVAIAMVLSLSAASGFDFALVFGCIAFAMACKYSFAVSGMVVVAVALFQAQKRRKLTVAIAWAAISFAVFTMPILARNWYLYGDPVSPFLSRDPEASQLQAKEWAAVNAAGVANISAVVLSSCAQIVQCDFPELRLACPGHGEGDASGTVSRQA